MLIALWATVGLLIAFAGVSGGYYLWLDAKVSSANERVPEDVWAALADDSTTTTQPATSTTGTLEISTTTTEPAPDPPDAMNILLLGSDRRSSSGKGGRSDTIMLVHVDPANYYLSILSFPRDLRVSIPGRGKGKLNTAFAYGGPALTIKTIQQLTGVDIDHYLEVDFRAFRDMTYSLGGVYVEVDRRYYYQGGEYEKISLQPGYQLLNGDDALDYVRFRHDRNLDFGRMDRQQRFLTALRQQAMGWDLAFKLPGLIGAFFDNVATTLGTNDFIKLAWWGVRLDGGRIRQVTLRGSVGTISGASYVICSEAQISAAVKGLLEIPGTGEATGEVTPPTEPSATDTTAALPLAGVQADVLNSTAGTGQAANAAELLQSLGATVVTVDNASEDVTATQVRYPAGAAAAAGRVASAVGTTTVGESASVVRITVLLGSDFKLPSWFTPPPTPSSIIDSAVWRRVATKVPFLVRAPAYIPSGYRISTRTDNYATVYKIRVGDDKVPALVMLYRLRVKGAATDQYLNVTETTWLEAPAASAGREVIHRGTVYTIVGGASGVERIWWKSDGVLYWVSNTLSHLASEAELLAMAQSTIPIPAR